MFQSAVRIVFVALLRRRVVFRPRPGRPGQAAEIVVQGLGLQQDRAAGIHGASDQSAQGVVGIPVIQISGHVLHLVKLPVSGVGVGVLVAGGGGRLKVPSELVVGIVDGGAIAILYLGQRAAIGRVGVPGQRELRVRAQGDHGSLAVIVVAELVFLGDIIAVRIAARIGKMPAALQRPQASSCVIRGTYRNKEFDFRVGGTSLTVIRGLHRCSLGIRCFGRQAEHYALIKLICVIGIRHRAAAGVGHS